MCGFTWIRRDVEFEGPRKYVDFRLLVGREKHDSKLVQIVDLPNLSTKIKLHLASLAERQT
jgi:hypothetical protein